MSNLQAAVGLAQLERFDELLGRRLANAEIYQQRLKGKGKWMFCAETENPRALQAFLKERGVDSRPVFTPLHLSPAFRPYAKGKYKVSEEVWSKHLCLPTGPHVSPDQTIRITELVNEFRHLHEPASSISKRAA